MRRRKTRRRSERLAERRRGQRQPDPSWILIHRTERLAGGPRTTGGLRRVRVWALRAVIFGYFGTLTDPGAEEYREPLAHRTGELLDGCRPRFWKALAGSFGERTIGVHGGTESTLRAVALSCGANRSSASSPSRSRITGAVMPASASRMYDGLADDFQVLPMVFS